MTRPILLIALLGLCTQLSASALLDEVFKDKKNAKDRTPEKVAEKWFEGLPKWVNYNTKAPKSVETYFRIPLTKEKKDAKSKRPPETKLCKFLIDSADKKDGLKARRILDSGNVDKDGRPECAAEVTAFKWDEWEAQYLLAVYSVESRETPTTTALGTIDLVGFACWLYDKEGRNRPDLANRVLTELWQRPALDSLRPAIEDFIREQEGIVRATQLALFDMWDGEFRVFRKMLIDAGQEQTLSKAREEEATEEWKRLTGEYKNPETRELTLAKIEFGLKEWKRLFSATKIAQEEATKTELDALLAKIVNDKTNADSFAVLGASFAKDDKPEDKPDYIKAAEHFEKARVLDPANLSLVSKAANAMNNAVKPSFSPGKKLMLGNEKAADGAIAQYEIWLARQPENSKVLLKLGELYHVKGDTKRAAEYYAKVIALGADADAVQKARDRKDAADLNPENKD